MLSKLKNFLLKIQTLWSIIGITFLFLLLCDGVAGLLSKKLAKRQKFRYDPPCYQGQNWYKEYDRERSQYAKRAYKKWHSYVYWKSKEFKGKHINIDNSGIRYTPQKTFASDKVFTIFMFGGSTMWGAGTRDHKTIASQVAFLLNTQKPKFACKIVNFGQNGYVNTQELLTLFLELRKKNTPDLVIFYDGANDVYAAIQSMVAGIPQNELNRHREFNVSKSRKKVAKVLLQKCLEESGIAKLANGFASDFQNIRRWENPLYNKLNEKQRNQLAQDVIQVYLNNIKIIKALAKSYNFKTLFYWQPVIYSKKAPSDYEQKVIAHTKALQGFFHRVYSKIHLQKDSNIHNISNIFGQDKQNYYLDFFHISEQGNAIIAKRMAKDIVALINMK